MSNDKLTPTAKPIYRMVWRWHFYAGLLVIPIVILLAVTGGIYLFKPYVEPILYQDLWYTTPQETRLPLADQLAAAQKASPNIPCTGVAIFADSARTTEISARARDGRTKLIYVNPFSGEVLGTLDRDSMLMRQVRKLHGELMLGTFGTTIVELAACWTVVLIASGLYLAWPRGRSKWLGTLWPRLRSGSRVFWRDIHAVTAIYASALIIILVMTGLPWSNVWGGAFKASLQMTGQGPPSAARRGAKFKSTISDGARRLSVDQVVKIATADGFSGTMTIALPRGPSGAFGISQRPLDLTESRFLHLDQYTGDVIAKADWRNYPIGAAAMTSGIRLHQGELFGIVNLLLMLAACVALILVAVSAVAMWWIRRPSGQLAAPPSGASLKASRPIAWMTLGFSILFPLVGVSIVLVLLCDFLVAKRMLSQE